MKRISFYQCLFCQIIAQRLYCRNYNILDPQLSSQVFTKMEDQENQAPTEADLKRQKLEEKIKRRQMELKEKSSANVTMATAASSGVNGLESSPTKNVGGPSQTGGIKSQDQSMVSPGQYGNMKNPLNSFLIGDSSNYQSSAGGSSVVIRKDGNQKFEKSEMSIDLNEMTMMNQTMMTGSEDHSIQSLLKNQALSSQLLKQKQQGNDLSQSKKPNASEFSIQPMQMGPNDGADVKGGEMEQNEEELFGDLLNDKKSANDPNSFLSGGQMNFGGQLGVGIRDISFINQNAPPNLDSFFGSIEGEKHAQGLREKYESTDNYNFYKDIVEEECDFSDGEDEQLRVSIKGMADATFKAANDAEVALPGEVLKSVKGIARESPQYQIDEISEKEEEDDSDRSNSSGGRGVQNAGKQPEEPQNDAGPSPAPKLKVDMLSNEEPLRLKLGPSSPAFVFGEMSDGESSGDSVEKAWQLALKGDGSLDGNLPESDEGSDKNEDGRPGFEEPDENELARLEALKQEDAQNYYEMIRGLVSFSFPATDPENQRNLDLAGYYKYMRSQLQLAPGTDTHAKRQLDSTKGGSSKKELTAHYQELSGVGFYGIQNNEEVLISIIILNNGSDIVEAQSKNSGNHRSSFNNIQQYLVPDLSMITLKSALKKILQSVTEDFDGDYYTKSEDLLGTHIMKRADFSVLLMLGKQYFHVCKFKQSIYCLSMAQVKCRSRTHKSKEDLAECNLWLALVHMVYLTNRVRIFKRNSEIKNVGDGTKLSEYMLMGAKEIFDIYSGLQDTLQEFLGAREKTTQGLSVVLYIQLKLEIFRQSDLFKKMVQMQVSRLEEEQQAALKEDSLKWIKEQEQQFQFHGAKGVRSTTTGAGHTGLDPGNKGRKGTMRGFLTQGFKGGKKKAEDGSTRSTMPVGGGLAESGLQNRKPFGTMFRKGAQQTKSKGTVSSEAEFRHSGEPARDSATQVPANSAEQTVRQRVVLARNESLRAEDLSMKVDSPASRQKLLEEIVKQISQCDPYIGAVAMSEIHFGKLDAKALKRPASASSLGSQPGSPQIEENKYESDYQIESVDFGELQKGVQALEELISDHPSKVLAGVKLWQFYRTQGCISSKRENLNDSRNDEMQENYDQAHQIVERLQYNYYERGSEPIADSVAAQQAAVETELLITLLSVKSLYDSENYASCFEILQSGYLGNSKYTGLLYLYGKYVVKSNTTENYKRTQEQKQFLGSGIGALEECLKSCMPEYHSRIYYYIGLAYNKQNSILNMPLKSISYWQQAKTLGFYWPYQGLQKTKVIKKFLDQYSFIQLIINLINESFEASGDCLDEKVPEKQAILAKQYLSVLTSFQEKVDGPSSLILKSNIFAYTLKRPKEAQECFTELSTKYPQVISGYLEHWEYLSKIYKKKRLLAKKNAEKAEALNSKTAKEKAAVEKRESHRLLRELKRITQKALHYSNSCVHVCTSEWVRVRQIAAKTYLLEKKFNKAIHIITDLCYVIPSYMLRIGDENASKGKNADPGGIRFCNQILAEDELSDAQLSEDEEGPQGKKPRQQDQLKNKIFIDKQHEEIIQNDFNDEAEEDQSRALFESRHLRTPAEKLLKASREANEKSKHMKKSQADQKPVFDYTQAEQVRPGDDEGGYGAPLETEGSNWDMSNFDPLEGQRDTDGPTGQSAKSPRGSNASEDSEAALRKYQQLVNEEKPRRNPRGMQIEIDQASDQSGNFGHLDQQTPQQIRTRPHKEFQTPRAIASKNSGTNMPGKLSASIAMSFRKKGLGAGLASTRSRGSNKRSFNLMSTRGSGYKPFHFGDRRGSDLGTSSLRINSGDKGVGQSIELRGIYNQNKMQADQQSVFDAEEYKNVNLMLRDKLPTQEMSGQQTDNKKTHELDENLIQSNTIFAVNSDVYFLYLIGKMCAQSGHNLFQGLQALNDYYLMTWHHGGANSSEASESKAVTHQKSRNPLNNQSIYSVTSGDRIKECVKVLWSIGQIYEKLEQPLLAQKYYLKILEDRERMAKLFGCKKYVLLAEEASGRIFMTRVSARMPQNLNQGFMVKNKGSIAEEESYVRKQGGQGLNQKKIIIKQNHF